MWPLVDTPVAPPVKRPLESMLTLDLPFATHPFLVGLPSCFLLIGSRFANDTAQRGARPLQTRPVTDPACHQKTGT